MINTAYLGIYFLSYAAGFTALTVALFAILRGAPALMKTYLSFLLSSVFFLLVRNLGFFTKMFLGARDIEQTLYFYVIYMASCGALVFSYIGLAIELRAGKRSAGGLAIAGLAAAIPLGCIPLLAATLKAGSPGIARLAFMNGMMVFTYGAVFAGLLFLFIVRGKIKDAFRKKLTDAILINGALYVLVAALQWLSYRNETYSLNPFTIINVNLTLVFSSSAYLIGKEYLSPGSTDGEGAKPDVFMPELPEVENEIIAMIQKGKKNKEIAEELGLTLARVKNIVYRIFSRFDVNSRTELLAVLGKREARRDQDTPKALN